MWTSTLTLAAVLALAHGHGRVLDPAGRGSVWRLGYSAARANYDDDGLNCGGFDHQYSVNEGKCGICGDPYDASIPRPHERGGSYDSGIIAGTYQEGSVFTATVQITAYHKGFWEFKICPDPEVNSQDCFNSYPVELEEGGYLYYPSQSGRFEVNYRLPQGLSCENCVLQWKYTAGNNWGTCSNGTQGLGCGNQEQFGACSDITIVGTSGSGSSSTAANQPLIPVDSLLLSRINDLGLLRLLLNSGTPFWVRSNTIVPRHKSRTKQRRKTKNKPKKKTKSKPKQKWSVSW